MKSRHNTIQDQPIVNVTDDTSDALLRMRTLAPPVCAAADSSTANSGRSMMNARRSISGSWCSMAILIAFAVMLAVCIAPALAAAGNAPNITSWSNSKTNDQSLDITVNISEDVYFNATANQSDITWNWYDNGANKSHNYDNITLNWSSSGLKTVIVNATNTNGTSDPVQWNVTVNPVTWWNSSWNYYKQLTINHTYVNGSQTDFPMMINITDTELALKAQQDGDDIVFVSEDHITQLDHEIEYWNKTTGEIITWVRIPSLSGTVNTTINMYYNNSIATNSENSSGVWDANYVMVQHLNETPSGTTYDSTSNANDGITVNMDSADQVSGQVDGSLNFDGSDHSIDLGDLDITGEFTISGWVYKRSSGPQTLIGKADSGGSDYSYYFRINHGSGFYNGTSHETITIPDLSLTTWHYTVITYDGSNLTYYLNGDYNISNVVNGNPSNITYNTNIGQLGEYTTGQLFDGIIDEVRISTIARSHGWIETIYNNTNSPSTFYSVGAEQTETAGNAPNITSWSNNKTNDQSLAITVNISEDVYFNATANQSDITWNWYDNGANQSHNYDNITLNWSSSGLKTVIVNATNTNGTSDPVQWTVTISPAAGNAPNITSWSNNKTNDQSLAITVNISEDVYFNATANQSDITWNWYDNGANQSHNYDNITLNWSSSGLKTVIVNATNTNGTSDPVQWTVTISPAAGNAPNITSWSNNKTNDQSLAITVNISEDVYFNATANQSDITWNWYDNGANQSHNYDNITLNWSSSGLKTVIVNATNTNGTSDPVQWTVTISPAAGNAPNITSWSNNKTNDQSLAITVNISEDVYFNATANQSDITWNWYDNGANQSHNYDNITLNWSSSGLKTVIVNATNTNGTSDPVQWTVTISPAAGNAPNITSWSNNKTNDQSLAITVNISEDVYFNATANQSDITWNWYDNGANQSHNYDNITLNWSSSGLKTVIVNATNTNGTSDPVQWTVTISPAAGNAPNITSWSNNKTNDQSLAITVNISEDVYFNATANQSDITWNWYDNGANQSHNYDNITLNWSSSGLKTVIVNATNTNGTSDPVQWTVTISPAAGNAPNITSWSNNKTNDQSLAITVNISEDVYFNATANQSDITWNWYDNGANQSHNYDNITLNWSSSGLKTVIVNATNTNGTSDPVQWTVTISPAAGNAPNITSWSNNKTNDQSLAITVNISEDVYFNATANQSDITWNWYDNGANQSHNYDNITLNWSSSGLKTVIVNATNTNGTSDPVQWTVTISPAAGNAPNITSWSNNKTNDQSLAITVNISEDVYFNATANQSDITWNWYDNGANQSHNYDNITLNWSSSGLKTVIVNATNTNGTSDPVQWTVTVNAPPETKNVTNGTGNATSGSSTATVKLTNISVNGTITIKELGDPINETEDIGNRTGLGTDTRPVKGVDITVNASIVKALNETGSYIHIRIGYNQSQVDSRGIDENTLYIYKFVNGTGWVRLVQGSNYCIANGRNTTADQVWVNVTNCSILLLTGTPTATPTPSGGGGGGGGTYPPRWFGTPTPTVTATKAPAATTTATDAPSDERVTPTPAKRPDATKTTTPTATETAKTDTPGLTAVFAIAGLLAVAYAMLRRRE